MLSSRLLPKRYFESHVLMFWFKTILKRSVCSAESTVWPIIFLSLGDMFSFCASINLSAISRTADAAKTDTFWIDDNLLSALLWCFVACGTSKLISLSNISFDALQMLTVLLLGFFYGEWITVTIIIRGLIKLDSEGWRDCEALTEKLADILYHFLLVTYQWIVCRNGLLQSTSQFENGIFHSIQSSFKIKILSCSCNRYS